MECVSSRRWLEGLDDEDVAFLRRFLLASGSLKEVARVYGVSYPTVRLRLDRLIQKVEILEDLTAGDEYERLLRAEAAEGRLDTRTLKTLLAGYQRTRGSTMENPT